jgi:hypothetical protein
LQKSFDGKNVKTARPLREAQSQQGEARRWSKTFYCFVAHTPSTVEAVPRGDETQAEAVERSARSALRKDMRRQIHDQLIEVTGGNVQWDSTPD